MKKNYSSRIFNILCKRVYKLSKKQKLGWTWNDCQRWTSAYLFKQYKGKPISKIKVTKVDVEINSILESAPTTAPLTQPVAPEVCSSVTLVPDVDLQPLEFWWDIDVSRFSVFNDDLYIRIVVAGIVDTGIVKKKDLDIVKIREIFRVFYNNTYPPDPPLYIFKRMYKFGKKGSTNPCDTYLLLTEENSIYDSESDKDEVKAKVKVSDLPKEAQKERSESKEKGKKTKAEIRKIELPKEVEGKKKPVKNLEVEKTESLINQLQQLNDDFKNGKITLEEFKKLRHKIASKFESGGIT